MALVGIYREFTDFLVRSIIKQLACIVCQFTFQTILVIHGVVGIIHSKIKSESGRIAGKDIVQTAVLQLVIVAVLEVSVYINRTFTIVRKGTVVTHTQFVILVYLIAIFSIDIMLPALCIDFLCLRDVIYLSVIRMLGCQIHHRHYMRITRIVRDIQR